MTTHIRIGILATVLALAGCAAPLYEWNGQDSRTFQLMKSPNTAESFRASLETHLQAMETQKKRPAPGLYAELGTLYLQRGDVEGALRNYRLERDTWAESRPFMTALISQLEKRGRPESGASAADATANTGAQGK